ncbi:MAG: hypothetical protein IKE76_02665 [Clostridia bacterium]|nr:hypothetical protein [Clostridia bacterium]
MAGIYIPSMEMPQRDEVISIYPDGTAHRHHLGLRLHISESKAVPVPDHGRLIDADALYEKFLLLEREAMSALQTTSIGSVDGIKWSAILTERTGYKFDIVDASTIIPADKEAKL